jgi:hypothetical protein
MVGFQYIPTRDHIAGRELLEQDSGNGPKIQGVELDQVSRAARHIVGWFSSRIRTGWTTLPCRDGISKRFEESALFFQIRENPAHRGGRDGSALAFE